MKNQYLLCLLFLWLLGSQVALAQCPTGNVTLSNQAAVNAFPAGCSTVPGFLLISGTDITNLSGLQSLTSVGGNLNISTNPFLTSVSSLSALRQVGGYLTISDNNALPTLSGLQSLTSVEDNLNISTNPSLTSVSSLSALRQVRGYLTISGNNALPTLSGLQSLTSVGDNLNISTNPSLTSVSSLSALRQVGGYLTISDNNALPTLSGLQSLTSVGDNLNISTNPSLTSVSSLSALRQVRGYLTISGNNALPTLSGLQSLTSVGGNLTIQNNTQLSTCATESICRLLPTITGNKTISGNAPGCATLVEVETNCARPTIMGFAVSPNNICAGSPVSFTARVGNVSGSYSYTLSNGTSTTSGTASTTALAQTLIASGSGNQSFTLTLSNGSQTATAVTSLTVGQSGVTRLYVKANASGANTGLNWQDAFTDLQSALKYPCTGSLSEIWIARGVYKPGSGNDFFSMLPDVAIYGGFEGTETDLNQRPPITLNNPSSTTLSADIDGDGTVANNNIAIIYNTRQLTSTAILDGIVMNQTQYAEATVGAITNVSSGDPTYAELDQPVGNESSAQFRNILFTGFVNVGRASPFFVANRALKGGVTKPSFINCVFRDNQFGLVANEGNDFSSGISTVVAPQFVNCVIANNASATQGGPGLPFLYLLQTNSTDQSAFINCSFLNVPTGVVGSTPSSENVSSSNDIRFTNCVLWNTGGVNTFTKFGTNSVLNVTAQYSLLDQATTGYTSGPGNLTTTSSPFVSASDLNLSNTSPAVNAGNPASVTVASGPYSATNLPRTDAAANPRIVGAQVDMGALEVQTTPPPCGTVVYVTQTGAGLQNGSSWTNAFSGTALQTAINTAAGCGAQVWVAQGLYKPTTGTDRTISFVMKEGVAIYGGFLGNEVQLSARAPVNPVTGQPSSSTLSGDIGTPGDSGADSDNSYHIIANGSGLSERAVLDGFLLTRANAGFSESESGNGGAIANNGPLCNPTIRNCLLVNNYATNQGGGIYNKNSSPLIENCVFDTNGGSQMGGAIYSEGSTTLVVKTSAFKNNQSSVGGAVGINGQGSLMLTDCSFEGNTADEGGSIYVNDYIDMRLTRCQFINNTAKDGKGGVMYMAQGSLIATNCLFRSNSSTKEGGALSSQVNATLINCIFQDNSSNRNGGAISASTSMTLVNCGFHGNRANQGGGIYTGGYMTISNCSFLSNQANQGGAIASEGLTVQLINSVLWNNGVTNSFTYPYGDDQVSASYSLFEPGVTGYTDGGNNLTTTVSPFISTTSTQLRDCSPAINTGSNQAYRAVSGPATDLAGNARQYNNGVIDRGAYEYQGNLTNLMVVNPSVTTATVNQPFSQSFTARRGSGPYSFSVVSSNLPASLSLSSAGVLSGTPTQMGSYSVLVQASDANGCGGVASTAYSLVVTDATPTITGFAVVSNRVCVGSPITFTATIGNITGNYSWSLENGGPPIGSPGSTTATAFSAVLTASGSGVQTYTLTVNSGGQVVTTTTSLTVNALPIVSLINNGPLTCTQTSVTLTASGGTSYTFTNGSGQLVPGSSNTRTVSSPGTYSVAVGDVNGCVSSTSTTVSQNVIAALVTINPSSTTLTNASPSVSLTAVGNGTFLWSTGATSQVISVTASGTYSVTLTSPTGCTATASVPVIGSDLTVTLELPQANFAASGSVGNFVVHVFEVAGLPTSSGHVRITITAPIGYTLSYSSSLTTIQVSGGGTVDVNNDQWTVTNSLANRQLTLTMNSAAFINGGGESDLGFSLTRTTANSGSTANITVNVADDLTMTYDSNLANNVYARVISGL